MLYFGSTNVMNFEKIAAPVRLSDMKNPPTFEEINSLFVNGDPGKVWGQMAAIACRIDPGYDFRIVRAIFDDVLRLFGGEYPGYSSVKTLYHDLTHTLDVFLCAARLMHGLHLSGRALTGDEVSLVLIATLMHDIGYAQLEGEENGTGAQYTQTHVKRGVAFMQCYMTERQFPASFAASLEPMISSTDPALNFSEIAFPDDRVRLLGQLVATADLTGQMANRAYLEKLLLLYLEFKEAQFGNFRSIHDMLRQTRKFYEVTLAKLDGQFGALYVNLALHFKDTMGAGRNYYMESIEKKITYLSYVIELDEADLHSMLKRDGIVEKAQTIAAP